MDNNQVSNIAHNLMYKLNVEERFKSEIERLVCLHWPQRGVIYRFLCNIVPGSKVVDKNENYYIVQWHEETCRKLMTKVTSNTLVQQQRRLRDVITNEQIVEVKVWK